MIKFRIRASSANSIMTGEIGLSVAQQEELSDYELRNSGNHPKGLKLTDKMRIKMAQLQYKKIHPELPSGCKSYLKSWLKETLYKRRREIKSRYIDKGNDTEETAFTSMAVQLGLGMVYKNDAFCKNDFMMGTCDLHHKENNCVYDNKSSWSLDQFPMFETECPNQDYIAQIQVYMELWNTEKGAIVYTLNDCPESILIRQFPYNGTPNERQQVAINLIYTLEYWELMKAKYFPDADEVEFVEIPEKNRVKPFYFERDREFIKEVEERVKLCNEYVNNELLPKINK